ncbi:MAG: hypothetical protein JNL97_10875, partial [Verrucomicrobiales bacterium]|nr:hypothetical protein [Verrucomicrobiales bacterium]
MNARVPPVSRPSPRLRSARRLAAIPIPPVAGAVVALFFADTGGPRAETPSPRTGSEITASTAQPSESLPSSEIRAAMDRGVRWLLANQNSNGWWSTSEQPAVTALALTALNRDPS